MIHDELELEVSDDLGDVWHVGYAPDAWAWVPWRYADDEGLFGGRWDDQLGQFRTLYTADSLLGCFLELLARFRPSRTVLDALDDVEDDDSSVGEFPEAAPGAVGYSWLDGREYGSARQVGRYCFITHSRSLATLIAHYPLERHGLAAIDVDAALLKDARDRHLTRSIARWLYDLHDDGGSVIDGVRFLSRHGDDIRVWAVFERAGDPSRSPRINPTSEPTRVSPNLPVLQAAFERFGLHWFRD
ncbi:RES domain-containing protein [Microbacterium sp.]|uniref:RES domain-containing protein n=1 Tax=Microbacterium sp. TaxID=51671 RepID=UPI00273610ED|nr:RES domain-containing protein [Microbacterium sp.]MDP3949519.1 RES domain-containing protein [Microbacterium sp.]